MARRRFSNARMIEAIRKAEGNLSAAARSLGCERGTVHDYVNAYDDVRAAYGDANETVLDVVEGKLVEQAKAGLPEQVRFYLRTKGRARGYGDHLKVEGMDLARLTVEQLAAIAAGKDPGPL